MTTDTLERTDTGTHAAVRTVDPACHLCGCHGWTPDKPLPAEVSEPQCLHVIADRSGRNEKAYPKDNWQDVSHRTAVKFGRRWADLHDMATEFRAWVDSLPGVPEPEWAEWDDAEQQAKFDQWHEQEPESPSNSHDGLARRAEQRGTAGLLTLARSGVDVPDDAVAAVSYDPDSYTDTPPEPRRLLRDEWSAFWADLRRLPGELRAWRPWKRGRADA